MIAIDSRIAITRPVFVSDWGEFVIPDDVPIREFRRDGWFDRRRKNTPNLKAYFEAMTECKRDNQPILTWAEWQSRRCL
jgi:hypothetical protein